MGILSSIKRAFSDNEVVFEGATDNDREEFERLVRQITLIYKGKIERETLLMMRFNEEMKASTTSEGNIVYRIFGNRSFSKEALFDAYKKAAIDATRSYTPR